MAAAALIVSILALAVSVAAVLYTRRQTLAQESRERHAGTPDIRVVPLGSGDYAHGPNLGAYMLRLVGPAHMDSVVVRRPTARNLSNGVGGRSHGTFADRYDMGPVRLTQSRVFWISFVPADTAAGVAPADPADTSFDLIVDCRRGQDSWEVVSRLVRPYEVDDSLH